MLHGLCYTNYTNGLHPGERPGPGWRTSLAEVALRYCHLSNWDPASAGVVCHELEGCGTDKPRPPANHTTLP